MPPGWLRSCWVDNPDVLITECLFIPRSPDSESGASVCRPVAFFFFFKLPKTSRRRAHHLHLHLHPSCRQQQTQGWGSQSVEKHRKPSGGDTHARNDMEFCFPPPPSIPPSSLLPLRFPCRPLFIPADTPPHPTSPSTSCRLMDIGPCPPGEVSFSFFFFLVIFINMLPRRSSSTDPICCSDQ